MNVGKRPTAALLALVISAGCSTEPRDSDGGAATADSVSESSYVVAGFPTDFSSDTPRTAELDQAKAALDQALANGQLRDQDFRPAGGDGQHISLSDTTTSWAVIMPHRLSHRTPIRPGKSLAIIDSDSVNPALGLGKGINYWVAAKSGTDFFSIMFPTDGTPPAAVPMKPLAHNDSIDKHEGAIARWVVQRGTKREGVDGAWATCSSDDCCCTGSSCDLVLQRN